MKPKDTIALWRAHGEKFGDEGCSVTSFSPDQWPKLAELLQKAIDTGVPLTEKKAREAFGMEMPPPGSNY